MYIWYNLLFVSHGMTWYFSIPTAVAERVLKKHTQVKVPLPSKKFSVSRVKVLVQKTT